MAQDNPATAPSGASVYKLRPNMSPAKMDDQDLYFAHSMCHAFFRNMSRAVKVDGWTKETLLTYYRIVVKEMLTRDMIVVPTPDELGESVVDIVPEPVPVEKELGVEDAGDSMTQPRIEGGKKAKKKKTTTKIVDEDETLPTDPVEVMAKALAYFQKYNSKSILAVLQIAEEADMLREMEEAQDAKAQDAANSGGSEDR